MRDPRPAPSILSQPFLHQLKSLRAAISTRRHLYSSGSAFTGGKLFIAPLAQNQSDSVNHSSFQLRVVFVAKLDTWVRRTTSTSINASSNSGMTDRSSGLSRTTSRAVLRWLSVSMQAFIVKISSTQLCVQAGKETSRPLPRPRLTISKTDTMAHPGYPPRVCFNLQDGLCEHQ